MSIKKWAKSSKWIYDINAQIKSRLIEKQAAQQLGEYRQKAAHQGIHALDEPELTQAVRRRIAARRGGSIQPKAMGQLHIFLAYYLTNWEMILPMALEPFGQVTSFEWRGLGVDDSSPDWAERGRDQMNQAMLKAFEEAHRQRPVDVVVGYLSGANTLPGTLKTMAATGAAIFNFNWDDKVTFPGDRVGGIYRSPAAFADVVDLNLTNAPESVIKYYCHDGLAMFWPEAAHPDVHKPYDCNFDYDVSFVGHAYGWRPRFIDKLEKMGIQVERFGKGTANGPLSDQEMIKLYSRSRINLGFGGIGHSRKLMCLKGRDFEVPMSGGLYLSQDNPELSRVFEIGKEIVTYRDEADCARIIRELLVDPEKADQIRKAGRARALRDHTYKARWRQVLNLAGLLA